MLNVQTIVYEANRTIEQGNIRGVFTWSHLWSTYLGDDRALTEDEYANCKRKPMPPPLPYPGLFLEVAKPMYAGMKKYITEIINSN